MLGGPEMLVNRSGWCMATAKCSSPGIPRGGRCVGTFVAWVVAQAFTSVRTMGLEFNRLSTTVGRRSEQTWAYLIRVRDGTIVSRNNLPSPLNPMTFFDGPSCEPVNSTIKRVSLSNTANAYWVVYRDSRCTGNGHGEFILHSYALSLTSHP